MRADVHVIVVMGVSAAGKTAVGEALARALGWRFVEGDDYHSAANKAKMHRGDALTDADRAPWLLALRDAIAHAIHEDDHIVLACSALKQQYRVMLVPDDAPPGAVRFAFLNVPRDVLEQRARHRHHPFATPALLDSQLATLEPPRDAIWLDGTKSIPEIVHSARAALAL
ncbi:MAG TPA: gluconokinase [Gemmatimonadaceae bacterium]|nr:gluconokinase [Gemmatimonadaceae bacterium]